MSGARLTRHYAPSQRAAEPTRGSPKYEHLYQREIGHAASLAERVEAFLSQEESRQTFESVYRCRAVVCAVRAASITTSM